jgi:hypothetical protein
MANRVSSDELTWLVTAAFREVRPREQFRISVAIVPDKACGWRAIIDKHTRGHMNETLTQEIAKIEQRLRQEYRLVN